jgi:dTDP-4-dehydrorhamnose 3,5-epimerase
VSLSPKAQSLYKLQSYDGRAGIDGVAVHALRRFRDEGGALTELLRLESGGASGLAGFRPVQVNYSCLQPGRIKALHVHLRQTDVWFVPPEDRVLVVVVDVRAGSPTEGGTLRLLLGDGESALLRIPPGVAHGMRNVGDRPARVLYFTDRLFSVDPTECDEGRLPWDLVGREVWEPPID